MSPFPLENLNEVTGPPPAEVSDEHLFGRQTSREELVASLPEEPGPSTAPSASDTLVQERTSSRKAQTITSQSSNLRDVNPGKQKAKSEAESSRAQEARRSQQALLSPRDIASPAPGSRSRESQATALPRFLYNQSNLEEQLEAARMLQDSTPPLSVASGKNTVASRLATELYTSSYLIFFSIWGTLARLGLQALTFYPGAPVVISVLWPNFAGAFVLGFLAEDRRLFREEWGSHKPDTPSFDPKTRDTMSPTSEKFHFANRRGHRDEDQPSQVVSHGKVKKTIPLFIGLATGFCGSFTSFSSFMRDVFLTLSNNLPTPINHTYPQGFTIPPTTDAIHRASGYSFMAVVAVILLTICLSVGALRFGAHFAILLDPYLPTIRFHFLRRFIDPVFVFLGWGIWLGAIFMTIWPPDRPSGPQSQGSWDLETWRGQALFACAFAPVGCLLRFYISLYLNGFSVSFPLGTFAVNIFGTAVEGMAFDLQHVPIVNSLVGGGRVPCQVLQGVMDGFCGCLTTVSTWAAELNGLKRHHAYVYGISSIVGGLSLMVAIMGSVRWTVGWSDPVCVV
jgi:CrcB protein